MEMQALHVATKKGIIYTPKAEAALKNRFAFEKYLGEGIMDAKRGCGKLILNGAESVDKAKVRGIIEESFGKKLAERYLEKGDILEIFHYSDYAGLAIMKQIAGVPYLDKFVVAKGCQGNGLGKVIIAEIMDHYYKLVWRTTPQNPINRMYKQVAQWSVRANEWNIYWINLEPHEIVPSVIAASMLERMLF